MKNSIEFRISSVVIENVWTINNSVSWITFLQKHRIVTESWRYCATFFIQPDGVDFCPKNSIFLLVCKFTASNSPPRKLPSTFCGPALTRWIFQRHPVGCWFSHTYACTRTQVEDTLRSTSSKNVLKANTCILRRLGSFSLQHPLFSFVFGLRDIHPRFHMSQEVISPIPFPSSFRLHTLDLNLFAQTHTWTLH